MQQCEASAANGYSMQCDAFCHNPAHSIVAENCMPGAPPTEWDVNGAGHEVEGFATRASLLPGYTVEFKLRSLRAEALRVDVYRHGYYQGLGARLVGATLDGATFDGARLVGADLSDSTVDGASFARADLSSTTLSMIRGYRAAR